MEVMLNYEKRISCHLNMFVLLNKIYFYTHLTPKMSGTVTDKLAYVSIVT